MFLGCRSHRRSNHPKKIANRGSCQEFEAWLETQPSQKDIDIIETAKCGLCYNSAICTIPDEFNDLIVYDDDEDEVMDQQSETTKDETNNSLSISNNNQGSSGVHPGIIGGGIAGVLVLIMGIFKFVRRKKQNTYFDENGYLVSGLPYKDDDPMTSNVGGSSRTIDLSSNCGSDNINNNNNINSDSIVEDNVEACVPMDNDYGLDEHNNGVANPNHHHIAVGIPSDDDDDQFNRSDMNRPVIPTGSLYPKVAVDDNDEIVYEMVRPPPPPLEADGLLGHHHHR